METKLNYGHTSDTVNLYVQIVDRRIVDIIMPNRLGIMTAERPKLRNNWNAVIWPVNPHETGQRGIIEILESKLS